MEVMARLQVGHLPNPIFEPHKGDPPVPGGPAADLVLIQPSELLAGLEVLLRRPPPPGDFDQGGEGNVAG
jgi:hypothetical protein